MSEDTQASGEFTKPSDIGTNPADEATRWMLEINLALKDEREWRDMGLKILEKYRTKKSKKNGFNILWSNTETLRQAVYNTLPKPDVRRRFRDEDPVGKVVSNVIERCASYAIDVYDFDNVMKMDLLDMLLPGRGISRVKYIPDLEDIEVDESQESENQSEGEEVAESSEMPSLEKKGEAEEPEVQQRIAYESVVCEHVQWDDFIHGPGKTWDEVRWVGFRHKFTETAGVEKFGDDFLDVQLDSACDEQIAKAEPQIAKLFKTADVWEIWDKDTKKVFFVAEGYKKKVLYPIDNSDGEDPLGLDGFFPCPRPLYAIEDASSLVPAPLYEQYRQQAEELDRVSTRINMITDALKLRGFYNGVLEEIPRILEADDNQLIALTNALMLGEGGDIRKQIMYMPIDMAAGVLEILTKQRESSKAVIYEITGISDIMRGATNAQETKGAQEIKSQWGTQRLKKLQAEFQRYARDAIRIKSQVIANKFQLSTIKEMTGLKLADTDQEKDQIKAQKAAFDQFQQQQKQAQQGQQMPQGAPQ